MTLLLKHLKIKRWKVYIVGNWEFVSGKVNFKDREPVDYPPFPDTLRFQFFADGSYKIYIENGGTLMFGHFSFDDAGHMLMTEKGQYGFATRQTTVLKCDSKEFVCTVHDVMDKNNPLSTMVDVDPNADSLTFTYKRVGE